ncbi:MAG: hypothetical protein GY820_19070 [Gammaproteobacteria bacterium]|nr:hypothetical protein [Gammaproteobacteria bacterium]
MISYLDFIPKIMQKVAKNSKFRDLLRKMPYFAKSCGKRQMLQKVAVNGKCCDPATTETKSCLWMLHLTLSSVDTALM